MMLPTLTADEIKSLSRHTLRSFRVEAQRDVAIHRALADKARQEYEQAEKRLKFLQKLCPHEEIVTIGESWQGGGLYFVPSRCLVCDRQGERYDRELTIQKRIEENKRWKHGLAEEDIPDSVPLKSFVNPDSTNW